jgi:putative endonuclease
MRKVSTAYKIGTDAEDLAVKFMQGLGLELVARRYKTKNGEVDLIFADKAAHLLVFLEVKARRIVFDAGLVSKKQWQRIFATASEFVAQYPIFDNFTQRFDLLVLENQGVLNHVINVSLDFL